MKRYKPLQGDKETVKKLNELYQEGAALMNALSEKEKKKTFDALVEEMIHIMHNCSVNLPKDRVTQLKWLCVGLDAEHDASELGEGERKEKGAPSQAIMNIQPSLVELINLLCVQLGVVEEVEEEQ